MQLVSFSLSKNWYLFGEEGWVLVEIFQKNEQLLQFRNEIENFEYINSSLMRLQKSEIQIMQETQIFIQHYDDETNQHDIIQSVELQFTDNLINRSQINERLHW